MLFWKFNLGIYDLTETDQRFLPILKKGRPGPPEIIGGHEPTGNYAMGIKHHKASKTVLMPANIGRLYYMHGYQEHKNIILDAIRYVFPEAVETIQTNAPARVETILQEYTKNTPQNTAKKQSDGLILHLINLTGFSGNTYFEPLPVYSLQFNIKSKQKPKKVYSLSSGNPIKHNWENGFLKLELTKLEEFESVVMDW
jgi:hypothetical protein